MALGKGSSNFTSPYAGDGYDAVLKDFYEGPIREHINNKVTVLELTEKSTRKWTGRRVVWPVHMDRNEGVGARGESGDLPTAGTQGYVESSINAKFLYGRISLSGPVMAASAGDKGAFAEALKSEVAGMRRDLRNDLNRQTWGIMFDDGTHDGITGILARVDGTSGAGQTSIDVERVTSTSGFHEGTRYLKKNMSVVLGTKTELEGTSAGVQTTISSVTDKNTFACSAVTVADDDLIVRGASASANSFNNEIHGICHLIHDSTTYNCQNINVSANPDFASHRDESAVDRDLSLELMPLAYDACDEKGGDEPTHIIGHHSMRREYINLLQADVRYAPETLKGGQTTLTYAGGTKPTPIRFDKHAPYGRLYFLSMPDIKQYVMQDWKWADRDGSILSRESSKDNWEAFMCWYGNLGVERRNTHAVIEDLNHSNLIF